MYRTLPSTRPNFLISNWQLAICSFLYVSPNVVRASSECDKWTTWLKWKIKCKKNRTSHKSWEWKCIELQFVLKWGVFLWERKSLRIAPTCFSFFSSFHLSPRWNVVIKFELIQSSKLCRSFATHITLSFKLNGESFHLPFRVSLFSSFPFS